MQRPRFILFLVTAAVLFLVLQRLYVHVRNNHESFLNDTLNGAPSAFVINTLTPDENVAVSDGNISRNGAQAVNIKKGCEGFEVAILLVSVMAAFPMPWRRKVLGVVLGVLLVHVLNIVRIVSLYYLSIYRPKLFQLFHVTVWQAVIILLAMLFFFFWIDRVPAAAPEPKKKPAS